MTTGYWALEDVGIVGFCTFYLRLMLR